MRLAVGTLTIVPVRAPGHLDRRTAGRAMVLAPLVGLLLAGVLVVVLCLLGARAADRGCTLVAEGSARLEMSGLSPLLAAVLAVSMLAVLTRAIHLDGLADTADGLGSRRPAAQALAIMGRGDLGPFGVATLVLALLLQVAALQSLFARGAGLGALVIALVVSRLTLPLVCSDGILWRGPRGLGSTVAGSVSRAGLLVAALFSLAVIVVAAVVALPIDLTMALWVTVAVLAALGVAGALCRQCARRLGGITGDVLGACVEVAFTTCLVLLALS